MSLPIAVASLLTECNHLGGKPTELADFARQELHRGPALLVNANGALAGMLQTLQQAGATVAPLLAASTCPGGPLTQECYRALKDEILERLRQALPVAGVLLALHGSAAVEEIGDLEGDLLAAVRQAVGPRVPIVATLDLHAHVTEAMVVNADALVAWETYPHRDTEETGQRGAKLLLDIVAGKIKPTMAMAKVPVLVSGVHGHTEGEGPFADTMRETKALEGKDDVISTSAFLVHPYLDLPDMGGGALVITNDDPDMAAALAEGIARRYWDRRFDLDPPVFSPEEALERGWQIEGGPILLVETADCCGGGAAGDSVATLKALLVANKPAASLVPVVDPQVAAECHRLGVGNEISIALGHKLDSRWGEPMSIKAKIVRLSHGKFRYSGGLWGGQEGSMGPSAVMQVGLVQILVTSFATYDWADEQFRSINLDARSTKFVVVKNPMNYRLAFAGNYKAAFILDTPGPTPAVMHKVRYRNLKRPYYPADRDIPDLKPTIYRHA